MFEGREEDGEYGDFGEFEDEEERKMPVLAKVCCVGIGLIVVILTVALIYLFATVRHDPVCHFKDGDFVKPRDTNNPDVFDALTLAEYEAVYNFMMKGGGLNLTDFDDSSVNSNRVYLIELFMPTKSQVLAYLENGESKPERRAKVVVILGNGTVPTLVQYIVSPAANPRSMVLYDTSLARYSEKPLDKIEIRHLFSDVIVGATQELYSLLMTKYNLCYHNCTMNINCLRIELEQRSGYGSESGRLTWAKMFSNSAGIYSYPLGLNILINHTSTNVKEWSIRKVQFDSQEYDSISDLMDLFKQFNVSRNVSGTWNNWYGFATEVLPVKPVQGPKLIEPEGKRYMIRGQKVTYHNWEFTYHLSPSQGLKLYNIMVSGTRIAYELSLQQIFSTSSGFGSSTMLGESIQELVRGVDCPDSAVFLDTTLFVNSGHPITTRNSICVFENNGAMPLRRHYQRNTEGSFHFYFGAADYYLVVRTIASTGGADFIVDYNFRSNGGIEVKVYKTGYVETPLTEDSRFGKEEEDSEAQTSDTVTFKVDLDVNGRLNRFSKVLFDNKQSHSIEPANENRLKVQLIDTELNENETEPNDKGSMYSIIYSANRKTMNGHPKAYKIVKSSPLHSVLVTKYKDSEDVMETFIQNSINSVPYAFSDGDSLLDVDLVAWVSVVSNHLGSAEDIPSSATVQNVCSFSLNPHNYFIDRSTISTHDNVLVRSAKDTDREELLIETFGRSFETKCFPETFGPVGYNGNRKISHNP